MENILDTETLQHALHLLNEQLLLADAPHTGIVVCGGSALIAMNLVPRTTQDVDVVAVMKAGELADPEPLPEYLVYAAGKVAASMHLAENWLNNGPAAQFRLGLPAGFAERLHAVVIGEKLTVYYIDRIDQIFFKTFAAADRGGYHVNDLKRLSPTKEELVSAAKWCLTQDVSSQFREILKDMFNQLGWQNVSAEI